MKTVGICGNVKSHVYDYLVTSARHVYKVHDFADGVNLQTMEDLRDCSKLYIVGKAKDITDETWDIISWAYVTGVEIIPVHHISGLTIRLKAVRFLHALADGIEALG